MYALPAVHKSAKSAPATSGKKDMLAGGAVVSGIVLAVAAGKWLGQSIGDFVIWLIDQEFYWQDQVTERQAALTEAETKLAEIVAAREAAERENPEAVFEA